MTENELREKCVQHGTAPALRGSSCTVLHKRIQAVPSGGPTVRPTAQPTQETAPNAARTLGAHFFHAVGLVVILSVSPCITAYSSTR